jgi:protein involved in polysaccharide export with SLBB domain
MRAPGNDPGNAFITGEVRLPGTYQFGTGIDTYGKVLVKYFS